MPSYRAIRTGLVDSERVAELNYPAECLLVRIMLCADDYGLFTADPRLVRVMCFPRKIDSIRDADIARWLTECETAGVLRCYDSAGKPYCQIVGFGQRMDKSSKPKYPAPTEWDYREMAASSNGFREVPGKSRKSPETPGDSGKCPENTGSSGNPPPLPEQSESVNREAKSQSVKREGGTPPAPATDPDETKPDFAAALTALSKWSQIDRGHGLLEERNEGRMLTAWLRSLDDLPPILRGKEAIPQRALVPLVVDSLIKDGRKFSRWQYARGAVQGVLEEWARAGVPGAAAPEETSSQNPFASILQEAKS